MSLSERVLSAVARFERRLRSRYLVGSTRRAPVRLPEGLELTQLEDRILLSASPAPGVSPPAEADGLEVEAAPVTAELAPSSDAADEPAVSQLEPASTPDATESSSAASGASQQLRRELVFVDSGITSYEQLVESLYNNSDTSRQLDVIVLSADRDGVHQITEMLAAYRDLDAVHIVSHGTARAVQLGNVWLDNTTLSGYSGVISRWGGSLSADADLLLYGCNLAASSDGRTLLEALGTLSGADVAASTDDTGHASRGGDWQLEFQQGPLESTLAFDAAVQQDWHGLLALPTAYDDSYTVAEDGSLDSNSTWYNSSWQARRKLSFNNTSRAENLTDFPILVAIDSTRIDYAQTQDAGQDLRFVDADGTLLAHEIDTWDESGTSYVWVKVPQIDGSSSSDFVWMYYGNASAADGQNATAVWSQDYQAVYHLNEDPAVTAGVLSDSGSNAFHASNQGSLDAAGYIGSAQQFNGTSHYVDLGSDRAFLNSTTQATLSVWINTSTVSGAGDIIGVTRGNNASSSRASILRTGSDIQVIARSTDDNTEPAFYTTTTAPLTAGTWHHVVAVIDYANDSITVYVDGAAQALDSAPTFTNTSTPATNSMKATIGSNEDGSSSFFTGTIDEARIARAGRSADWVTAEYASMTDTLITYAGEQTAAGVLDNDSDPEGDSLTAVLVSGPANAAAFTLNADGSFTYTPTADFSGTDTFSYQANDGSGNSNTATVTITVTAVNDAPVIDLDANDSSGSGGRDFSTTFTEDGGAVAATDSDALLSDVDSASLSSLTVTITNLLDGASESLDASTGGTSITASYNSATGVLLLTGADSVANYQQVLRSVTYNNSAQNPNTTSRTVTFVADDGSDTSSIATTTIAVTSVNDAPTLDLDANDSSGESGSDFATSFTEGDPPVLIADADAVLGDVDNSTLASLTVTITNRSNGAAERLAANTAGTTITASYDGSTGVLTLSGVDSVANYQQVLRTITYENQSENPATSDRTITFAANDGTADSNLGTTTVTVTAVNDAPTLDLDADDSSGQTGSDYSATFTEDGGAVTVTDADATLDDVDSSTLSSLTVTITNLQDGVAESLNANTSGTSITASYNSGTGVLLLSGADSVANYQQVLRTVAYDNTSDDPDTTTRTLSFVANDGSLASNVGNTTLAVTAANDAPTLDLDGDNSSGAAGSDFDTTFTEAGGAVAIADADAVLGDADNSTLSSLTASITNLSDGVDELLAANTTGTSITASYNSGTGILTLSGVDSLANYQQVLRTVTYDNGSLNPTTAARSITFVANDGSLASNVGTATVAVVALNDAPELDLDANDSSGQTGGDYSATFTEDGGAVAVADADASLLDVDHATLSRLTATITNLLDGAAETLAANTTGTSISASYTSGTGVLTLNGTDSVANYQQVLRSITYNNSSQDPNTSSRTITLVANDGSADSNAGTTTVAINAVNDAPSLDLDADNSSGAAGADFNASFTEDGGAVPITDVDALLADADSGTLSSLTATLTNLLDGAAETLAANTTGTSITASYNSGTGVLTLSGVDSVTNYQQVLRSLTYNNILQDPDTTARTITLVASDGALVSNVATATVAVSAVNDAPAATADAYSVTEDNILSVGAGSGVLANDSDVENDGFTAVLVSSPTNGLLSLNADGSFTYTPASNYHGSDSFTYRADDGQASSPATTVTITVQPVNDAPVASDDTYTVDNNSVLQPPLPGVLANDSDIEADTLNVTLVSGPSGGRLTLNPDGTFSYTPNATFTGVDTFVYRINDGTDNGNTATASITVEAVAGPSAPAPPPSEPAPSEPADSSQDSNTVSSDSQLELLVGPHPNGRQAANENASTASIRRSAGASGSRDSIAKAAAEPTLRSTSVDEAGDEPEARFRYTGASVGGRDARDAGRGAAVSFGGLQFSFDTGLLFDKLDSLEDAYDASQSSGALAAGTAAAVTSALSAGYVLWTIRGGYLLASVLSSTPAWGLVDPLPILNDMGGLAKAAALGDDDESLETLTAGRSETGT